MITTKFKLDFFNDSKVKKALGRAERRAMIRSGALIRKTAQRSIRPRKKISRPGGPPHSHTKILRKLIVFAYGGPGENLVVGPLPRRGNSEVPPALEFGGTSSVVIRRKTRAEPSRRIKITIKARPYMAPALEKSAPQLPKFWRDSVK